MRAAGRRILVFFGALSSASGSTPGGGTFPDDETGASEFLIIF